MDIGITGYDRAVLFNSYKFLGFCLGRDYCPEHEQGIASIRTMFGMSKLPITDEAKVGLVGRTASIYPEENVLFMEKDNQAMLVIKKEIPSDRKALWKKIVCADLEFKQTGIYSSWSNDGIFILVDERHVSKLQELYDAITKKDFALLWLEGFHGYQNNSGLCAVIASKVPSFVDTGLKK